MSEQSNNKALAKKTDVQEYASAADVQKLKSAAHLADFDAEDWQTMMTALGVEDEAKFPVAAIAKAKDQVFAVGAKGA